MQRRTYVLLVSYDGGPYKGWQPDPTLPTVGGLLSASMHRVGVRATPFGASRTDAGVHARAQVASFTSREGIEPEELRRRLNEHLPSTVRIAAVRTAGSSFHSHWSSTGKVYRYRISFDSAPGAWRLPSERFPYRALDPIRLEEALAMIRAAPDVSALCASREPGKPRRILRAEALELGSRGALIEIEAGGFGRYLVRNLVSSALGLAVGALTPDRLLEILQGRAGHPPRAPSEGLCLHRVLYPAGVDPFPDIERLFESVSAPPIVDGFRRALSSHSS